MITEELKKLYCTYTGHEPEAIEELPSSGSNRRYFRVNQYTSYIEDDILVSTHCYLIL